MQKEREEQTLDHPILEWWSLWMEERDSIDSSSWISQECEGIPLMRTGCGDGWCSFLMIDWSIAFLGGWCWVCCPSFPFRGMIRRVVLPVGCLWLFWRRPGPHQIELEEEVSRRMNTLLLGRSCWWLNKMDKWSCARLWTAPLPFPSMLMIALAIYYRKNLVRRHVEVSKVGKRGGLPDRHKRMTNNPLHPTFLQSESTTRWGGCWRYLRKHRVIDPISKQQRSICHIAEQICRTSSQHLKKDM